MTLVQELVGILAPWEATYADSAVVSTIVMGTHLVALLSGGGLAVAADRTTLRALRRPVEERMTFLRELSEVHRVVIISLALVFVSGLLLAGADLETFAGSTVFWIKMALIGVLMVNGRLLLTTERRLSDAAALPDAPDTRLWRRLRVNSVVSLTLWLAITLLGVLLTNAA